MPQVPQYKYTPQNLDNSPNIKEKSYYLGLLTIFYYLCIVINNP